jgi:hypothetical protein
MDGGSGRWTAISSKVRARSSGWARASPSVTG